MAAGVSRAVTVALIALTVVVFAPRFAGAEEFRIGVQDPGGVPLPFRAYFYGSDDVFYHEGVVAYEKQRLSKESHLISGDMIRADVPPGKYSMRIERGLEWRSETLPIHLKAGSAQIIPVTLNRWVDMNAAGWYSGDTHVHRHPYEFELAARAEGLNFAVNLPFWNEKDAYEDQLLKKPEDMVRVVDDRATFVLSGQEIERFANGWGAILFLGDFEPIDLTPRADRPWPVHYARAARDAGAHLDHEKVIWSSVPVCAAFGLVDSVGVVHNHFHPKGYLPLEVIRSSIVPPPKESLTPRECALYTLDVYYKLLNCGLRIGASGGSASGVMPSPVGYERTYVRLDGEFSASAWLAGLKAGRSFATNGPIIELRVNGKDVGQSVHLDGETVPIEIRCTARSQEGLESLEIIHNGNVVASADGVRSKELGIDERLELGPGWVTARCFEKMSETQVYAATSPVYLDFGPEPFVVPESAAYFRDFVQSLIDTAIGSNQFAEGPERDGAITVLEDARSFYAARAK